MTIPAKVGNRKPFQDMTELVDIVRGRGATGVTLTATTTLTTDQSGGIFYLGAADFDVNLPAITAADVGVTFTFITTVAATDQKIIAQAGDILTGGAVIGGATGGGFAADGNDDLTIALNGTTKGGLVGSKIQVTAISASRWLVEGVLIGSGTAATPFS